MPTPASPIDLRYDYSGALRDEKRLKQADVDGLAEKLAAAHKQVVDDAAEFGKTGPRGAGSQPWDPGYVNFPAMLLDEYAKHRDASPLGKILRCAHRIRESVDRVVVLGIGGSYMGARAIFEAMCDPYFNEQSRGERGSRPRLYFEGNNVDNDSAQALLRHLGGRGQANGVDDRWAMVVISKSGGTLETAVAFRLFLKALRKSCGGDGSQLSHYIVPVTDKDSTLHKLTTALGCTQRYDVPDGVGGRFSVLTAVGLLPAAVLGLDIVKLLQGARKFTDYFLSRPQLAENIVLQQVGVSHLLEQKGYTTRVLSIWGKRLEAFGLWYDQLLAESLGKEQKGATPLTTVNTRDLHSRQQQHQQGRRDKLFTNVYVDQPTDDILSVGHSDLDDDGLNKYARKTLPEILTAAMQATNQALHDDGHPTTDLALSRLDESTLGQLFQMMMLATSVEGHLIGVNPYGQPGVEGYKVNMNAILSK